MSPDYILPIEFQLLLDLKPDSRGYSRCMDTGFSGKKLQSLTYSPTTIFILSNFLKKERPCHRRGRSSKDKAQVLSPKGLFAGTYEHETVVAIPEVARKSTVAVETRAAAIKTSHPEQAQVAVRIDNRLHGNSKPFV